MYIIITIGDRWLVNFYIGGLLGIGGGAKIGFWVSFNDENNLH